MSVTRNIAATVGVLLHGVLAFGQPELPEEDVYLILLGGSAMVSRLDGGGNVAACGSATLVEGGGYLISNYHVINTARARGNAGFKIAVHPVFHDGSESIQIQANHSDRIGDQDVVTVRVTEGARTGLDRYALFADLEVGTNVYTVGHPHCTPWQFSRGAVQSLWRRSDLKRDRRVDELLEQMRSNSRHKGDRYDELIITSKFLAPGNSGGPVADGWGRLIGVAFASGGSEFDVVLPIDKALRGATVTSRTAPKDYLPPWYRAVVRPQPTIPPTPADEARSIVLDNWEDTNTGTFLLGDETVAAFRVLESADFQESERTTMDLYTDALTAEARKHDLEYILIRLEEKFRPQDFARIRFQMADALTWPMRPIADLEFSEKSNEQRAFFIPETGIVAVPIKRTFPPDIEEVRLFRD